MKSSLCAECGAKIAQESSRGRVRIYCAECAARRRQQSKKHSSVKGRHKAKTNADIRELPSMKIRMDCPYYMGNERDPSAERNPNCHLVAVCKFRGFCVARRNERTAAQGARMRDNFKKYRQALGNLALAGGMV